LDRFIEKTLEEPEDREDSTFFHHLTNQTKEYKLFKKMEADLEEELKELKAKVNAQDMKRYSQTREAADRRRQKQMDENAAKRTGYDLFWN